MDLDMLIGSGGVLSHAPRRNQAAMMLIDAFQPEGITRLSVDSIFMMPQLGVLTEVHARAALEVFNKDCLIHLGTSIVPVGLGKEGKRILDYSFTLPDGKVESGELKFGEVKLIPLGLGPDGLPLKAKAVLEPARNFDVEAGPGKRLETEVTGGVVGVVLDGRGRPFNLPTDPKIRVSKLKEWMNALGCYPKEALEKN